MPARAIMIAILLLVFSRTEAVPGIIELPDRVIAELHGTPAAPAPAPPPPETPEPYLIERFVEHADHYEVELIGKPDGKKHTPEDQDGSAPSPAPTLTAQAAASPPSATSYGNGFSPATSPYYRELSERVRTLQRERQDYLRIAPEDGREERERKRREAEDKLREIRAVSAEMARMRDGGG